MGSAKGFKAVVYTGETSPLVKTVTVARDPEELVPGDDELLVKVHACACNPTDYKHVLVHWGDAGCTVGTDLAGTVVKVGGSATQTESTSTSTSAVGFAVGDSVASFVHGGYKYHADGGAFQEYVVVPKSTTLNLHRKLVNVRAEASGEVNLPAGSIFDTFESATSMPLGLCTVGQSLHHNFQLDSTASAVNSTQWLLVWGGTAATGFLAVQVAKKLYGLKVVTTANKARYGALLQDLGADAVVDYRDEDAVEQIRSLAEKDGGIVYALDCVSSETTFNSSYACLRDRSRGRAFHDNLLFLGPDVLTGGVDPEKDVSFHVTLAYLAHGQDQNLNGAIVKTSDALLKDHAAFWTLAQTLLDAGKLTHMPLTLLPDGLDSANEGLRRLQEGRVSCHKLVFSV